VWPSKGLPRPLHDLPKTTRLRICNIFGELLGNVEIVVGSGSNDFIKHVLDLSTRPGAVQSLARTVDADSVSKESISRMREWITSCDLMCKDCGSLQEKFLPTRLLDVRNSIIKLVLAASLDRADDLQYATLSHCWGACRAFMTTKTTLNANMTGFELAALPKTFQDAITIAKKLNILYL
jgi:hypothetical protein